MKKNRNISILCLLGFSTSFITYGYDPAGTDTTGGTAVASTLEPIKEPSIISAPGTLIGISVATEGSPKSGQEWKVGGHPTEYRMHESMKA
ncbi:MAG: hypothetical protein RRY13_08660 [Akkermansia sp.]